MRAVMALVLSLLATTALAQTSEDYTKMSKRSWSELVCSVWASLAHMNEEEKRLFNLGYNHGKTFLEAWAVGKVDGGDIHSGFLNAMHSPIDSVDFKMGQVWDTAERSVDNDLQPMQPGDREIPAQWGEIAAKKYESENCKLL